MQQDIQRIINGDNAQVEEGSAEGEGSTAEEPIESSAKGKSLFKGITALSRGERIFNARGISDIKNTGVYKISLPLKFKRHNGVLN